MPGYAECMALTQQHSACMQKSVYYNISCVCSKLHACRHQAMCKFTCMHACECCIMLFQEHDAGRQACVLQPEGKLERHTAASAQHNKHAGKVTTAITASDRPSNMQVNTKLAASSQLFDPTCCATSAQRYTLDQSSRRVSMSSYAVAAWSLSTFLIQRMST